MTDLYVTREKQGETYFATDGNYGPAQGLVIIDTSDFTDTDWEAIDIVPDSMRIEIAKRIKESIVFRKGVVL